MDRTAERATDLIDQIVRSRGGADLRLAFNCINRLARMPNSELFGDAIRRQYQRMRSIHEDDTGLGAFWSLHALLKCMSRGRITDSAIIANWHFMEEALTYAVMAESNLLKIPVSLPVLLRDRFSAAFKGESRDVVREEIGKKLDRCPAAGWYVLNWMGAEALPFIEEKVRHGRMKHSDARVAIRDMNSTAFQDREFSTLLEICWMVHVAEEAAVDDNARQICRHFANPGGRNFLVKTIVVAKPPCHCVYQAIAMAKYVSCSKVGAEDGIQKVLAEFAGRLEFPRNLRLEAAGVMRYREEAAGDEKLYDRPTGVSG